MVRPRTPRRAKDDYIREIKSRKEKADRDWKAVYERKMNGEPVSNDEVVFAMNASNNADLLCLRQGLSLLG